MVTNSSRDAARIPSLGDLGKTMMLFLCDDTTEKLFGKLCLIAIYIYGFHTSSRILTDITIYEKTPRIEENGFGSVAKIHEAQVVWRRRGLHCHL